MGGVGTDPNSMIPIALVFVAGYLAMTRVPVANKSLVARLATSTADRSWWERVMAKPTYAFRAIAALGAIGITLIGVVPMALAATNPNADPILTRAVSGPPTPVDTPAPNFRLIDQLGQPVSLASLRGKTLVITFLDDVCTTDCQLVPQEFRLADRMLGGNARSVELIAINDNPRYIASEYLRAYDHQEELSDLGNWRYLTGSTVAQLERVWQGFDRDIRYVPGGSTVPHSEFADVIDPSGHIRYVLNANPGWATSAARSSFAVSLVETLKSVIASS
jgi:cytochrome oxidase Cu insertion factor (SCO1/SenC/PrrC family)